jgi:hypothetical protein
MDYFTKCLKNLNFTTRYNRRRRLLPIHIYITQSLMKVVFIIFRSSGILSFCYKLKNFRLPCLISGCGIVKYLRPVAPTPV